MDEAPDVAVSAAGAVTYETSPWHKPCSGEWRVQLSEPANLRADHHLDHNDYSSRVLRGGVVDIAQDGSCLDFLLTTG